jgi:hypothetical protein
MRGKAGNASGRLAATSWAENDWTQILLHEVNARLEVGRRLYLAQVPALLRRNGVNIADITRGRKLLELVQAEASEVLLARLDSSLPGGWYLEPANEQEHGGNLLGPSQAKPARRAHTVPRRFLKPFWTAFIKRIPEGHRRFIGLDGNWFQDIRGAEPIPRSGIEITPDELADADLLLEDDNAAAIEAAIEKSVNSRKLNVEQFVIQPGRSVERVSIDQRQKWLSAMAGMSPADQSRIKIPLDIVLKLLSG